MADGPGLAFIAYPKALATMDGSTAWSICFFAMLVLLGIDSQFVGLEGLFTAILDIWPSLRSGRRPELVMGAACFASFLFGLLMCTQGGMWVFQLFDYYSASGFVLLWFCFFECVAISWAYGAQRFYSDIQVMIGYRISPWMLLCWAIIAPATCLVIFVVSLVEHRPIEVPTTTSQISRGPRVKVLCPVRRWRAWRTRPGRTDWAGFSLSPPCSPFPSPPSSPSFTHPGRGLRQKLRASLRPSTAGKTTQTQPRPSPPPSSTPRSRPRPTTLPSPTAPLALRIARVNYPLGCHFCRHRCFLLA